MRRLLCAFLLLASANAQVYSPKVLAARQPDASNLTRLAHSIYNRADANTPREKAEAIWRFYLTDGRYVEPGFWYHIAGWAYEEPAGEVLDLVKLINSYGFGLCYHIAPLLAATWKAGGFRDARVWFLTGHTVAEVFYDGEYHYFDSDMMGYNKRPTGVVASVRDIEANGSLITAQGTSQSIPWYPADVRENAIDGLAELFTTTNDNWLYAYERAPQSHTMDFVLRPGERLVRFFEPERANLSYLPYKEANGTWAEFPQEIAQYAIRTQDGPHSQKDNRRWGTGRLEYRPAPSTTPVQIIDVTSPYVIIGGEFEFDAALTSAADSVTAETSTDNGRTWLPAGRLSGPHKGPWRTEPSVLTRSEHGRRTTLSGRYAYQLRLSKTTGASLGNLHISTVVQLNPRTLPALNPGHNELTYTASAPQVRNELVIDPADACKAAHTCANASFVSDGSQGYWLPTAAGPAEFIFHVNSSNGVEAGARILNLTAGLAPDKFTAEVRKVPVFPSTNAEASIAWSTSPLGPYKTVWQYDPTLHWLDGKPETRLLIWPEVDRDIPLKSATDVYLRYRVRGLAID
ncbi:MAG: hypothetical protein ABI693_07415, partial [Bryobacteraceae bacterium]